MHLAASEAVLRTRTSVVHAASGSTRVAAPGDPQAVLREDAVAQSDELGEDRQPGEVHETAKSDRRIQLPEDFNTSDPLSVPPPRVDLSHQRIQVSAVERRLELRCGDVRELDLASSVHPFKRVLPVGPHDANGTRRYPHEPR
jgi:hypothetical protein